MKKNDKRKTPKNGKLCKGTIADDNHLSDLIRENPRSTPEDRAYQLESFVVNHIWGGGAYPAQDPPGGPYRAKLSVFGHSTLIGELYFYDLHLFQPDSLHKNPVAAPQFPPSPRGHYVLYFPISALAPIQRQLHQRGGERLLTYYDHEWCIETVGAIVISKSK